MSSPWWFAFLLGVAFGFAIGGVLSGLIVPPLTLAIGWQGALLACAGGERDLQLSRGHHHREQFAGGHQ